MQGLSAYQKAARKSSLTPSEREARILEHVRLVKKITNRIAMRLPPHAEIEDLYSAGILGLIDAVEKYDPGKGVPFEAYAEFRIRGAIFDELRALDPTPRALRTLSKKVEEMYSVLEAKLSRGPEDDEMAAALGVSLEEYRKILMQINSTLTLSLNELVGNRIGLQPRELLDSLEDTAGKNPAESFEMGELRDILAQAIDELPEKYRLVLALYYYEEMNMKEVGQALNITESRVSQIHSKSMMVLRKKIRASVGAMA